MSCLRSSITRKKANLSFLPLPPSPPLFSLTLPLQDLSYATPLLAALLHRLTRPSSSPNATLLSGPYTLGRFGAPINVIGLLFLVFASITFNFPGFAPVTAQNMNYTSAATGVIGLVSLVTWVVSGRKRFTGPKVSMGE